MDYDYEPADEFEGRVLWGRVGVLVGALLLVFILGRCTAGGDDEAAQRVEFLEGQVTSLQQENAELQQQLDAASSGQQVQETPTADATATESPGEPTAGESTTYTVQRNDTLYTIAQQHYGDGSKFQIIADANGIDSNNRLTVGQELIIPPDPSG